MPPSSSKVAAHTPGPWGVKREGHSLWVAPFFSFGDGPVVLSAPRMYETMQRRSGGKRGGTVEWYPFTEEQEANARLIAAAPDLLAACEAVAATLEAWERGAKEVAENAFDHKAQSWAGTLRGESLKLRAAISKARGVSL